MKHDVLRTSSPLREALYSATEAALVLGFSPARIYQLAACGEIESVVVGRRWMFEPEALDAYVAGLQPTPPAAA